MVGVGKLTKWSKVVVGKLAKHSSVEVMAVQTAEVTEVTGR